VLLGTDLISRLFAQGHQVTRVRSVELSPAEEQAYGGWNRVGVANGHLADLVADARRDGDFVLYWMTSSRRRRWNCALQRAVEWAREFRRPLLVLETLSSGLRWDSDRLHRFALDGLAENERQFERTSAAGLFTTSQTRLVSL